MKYLVLSLVGLMVAGLSVIASCPTCPGGSCPQPQYVQYQPTYAWGQYADDVTQIALYRDNYHIGSYSFTQNAYRRLINGEWGPVEPLPAFPAIPEAFKQKFQKSQTPKKCSCYPCSKNNCGDECPCQKKGKFPCARDECNCATATEKKGDLPTGVIPEKRGDPCTCINGVPCDPARAFAALEAGLPDDSTKMHLTIIDADDTRRAAILKQIQAVPESNRFLIQDINPSAPMEAWILECGFKKPTDGGTTIYCQDSRGKVLWREDTFDIKRIEIGLRKTDPQYDPKKDPTLDIIINPAPKPEPNVQPAASGLSIGEYVALGVLGLCVLSFASKGSK